METVRNCLPPRKTCARCNETIVLVQKTFTREKENKFNLTYVTFTICNLYHTGEANAIVAKATARAEGIEKVSLALQRQVCSSAFA